VSELTLTPSPAAENPAGLCASAALTIEDLQRIAKRRKPRAAFDYTDGAADEELTLAREWEALLHDSEFRPAILRDVATVNTAVNVLLGGRAALPFGIALTGFIWLMHTAGETAGTRVAEAGIPFSLSALGTPSIEEVCAATPHGRHWFQLYMRKKRGAVGGAVAAGGGRAVRHTAGDRRCTRRRSATAGHPQRHVDPAHTDRKDRARRDTSYSESTCASDISERLRTGEA
jgi:isopentenyl diphosphate isomerase/L-lactate dehydrogenase-like FMN-dependent dehydrogenase